MLNKLSKFCFYLFIVFLPFQVKALIFGKDVFFSGFFNPYLSYYLYLNDLLLFLGLLFFGLSYFFKKRDFILPRFDKITIFLLIFVLSNFVSILFSVDVFNSLIHSLRIFELFLLFLVFRSGFLDLRRILWFFIVVMGFVSFIGLYQYVFQSSLGLEILGEPILSSGIKGVAKMDVFGGSVLRAYGTFPHPNIFASFLSFALIFAGYLLRGERKTFLKNSLYVFVILFFFTLLLTFSRSAFLGLFFSSVFLIYFVRPKFFLRRMFFSILFLILVVFIFNLDGVFFERLISVAGFGERYNYLVVSKNMFFQNIFGVGAGDFTLVSQNYIDVKLNPWSFQPVHNSFLLLLNELGIQGFLVFVILFFSLPYYVWRKRNSLDRDYVVMLSTIWIFVLVVSQFDHYFISLYQGQVLLFLFFSLFSRSLYPLRKSGASISFFPSGCKS